MKRTLKNGMDIISITRPAKTCSLVVLVKTGSNSEEQRQLGISHFIEHMVFEGTKKRSSLDITRAIEGVGGDIGAYTTHDRTVFYVKVLPKHFDIALDILHDIMVNPTFRPKEIEKERKVILSEINMKLDEPRFLQWEMFLESAFRGHPVGKPIIGTPGTVSGITRSDLMSYFKTHYVPNNMIVSYCGPANDAPQKIERAFGRMKQGKVPQPVYTQPRQIKRKVVRKDIAQSYYIMGFPTVSHYHKDSYAIDVIRSILGRGLSGRIVNEIRTKRGMAYEVGVLHEASKEFGFLALYAGTQKKNLALCEKLIKREISELGNVSTKELKESKNFLEGEFVMEIEDVQKHADAAGFWKFCGMEGQVESYVKAIHKVTRQQVARAAEKYLKSPTVTILRQK